MITAVGACRTVVSERRWRRYRFNFLTNHLLWERFQPEFTRRIEDLDTDFDDLRAGLGEVGRANQLIVEYIEIHLLSEDIDPEAGLSRLQDAVSQLFLVQG